MYFHFKKLLRKLSIRLINCVVKEENKKKMSRSKNVFSLLTKSEKKFVRNNWLPSFTVDGHYQAVSPGSIFNILINDLENGGMIRDRDL